MKLDELRKELDEIDWQLLKLFHKRLDIAKKIGLVKKEKRLKVVNKNREMLVINSRQEKGVQMGIDKTFITNIWKLLMTESKKNQRGIIK